MNFEIKQLEPLEPAHVSIATDFDFSDNHASLDQLGATLTASQKLFVLERLNFGGVCDFDNLPRTASYMIEKIANMLCAESTLILKEFMEEHQCDPNIPNEDMERREKLILLAKGNEPSKEGSSTDSTIDGHTLVDSGDSLECDSDWSLMMRVEASLIKYYSPYSEVRAVCDPFDDTLVACETFRVYFLGMMWCGVGVFINTFFHDRQPKITLDSTVVQLLLYPSGRLMLATLPNWGFHVGAVHLQLNPGPWTHKEQMLATIFYSVSSGVSYVAYNITVQKLDRFYGNAWADYGYQILLILSTNFMGFGLAGIMRRFAVYPTRSIWPTILPALALNKAIMQPEEHENINGWTISRYSFMILVAALSFVYFWVPEYLFHALSTFNWLLWILPQNFNLTAVTGSNTGLGVNPLPTFDWNILNSNGALNVPFFNQLNTYIGMILGMAVILGTYYTNFKWTRYLPINSLGIFDNKGHHYKVRDVVNEHSLFDRSKYEEIGPPFYSAASLVTYGTFLALYPFAFLYQMCTDYQVQWKSMKQLCSSMKHHRSTYEGFDDPHCRMMAQYKEVPEWAFLSVLAVAVILAILCLKLYPVQTPVWTIFFAIGINFVFLVPLTAIYLVTGFSFGLNVLVQIIMGYACPGNGLALMFVKALGVNVDSQAQNYISDQKMAHYVKIPPRALFRCQMLSVFMALLLQIVVLNFVFVRVKDYCALDNKQKFTCPQSNVFFSALVVWGVIGPRKVFSTLYPQLKYCVLVGVLLVGPCVLIKSRLPRRYGKYFQPVLVLGGFLNYAPYNLSYYTGGLYLLFALMYYLKKRYTAWWDKYNYVFSGAMSAGVAFSSIVIFFAVQLNDRHIGWWGNNVLSQGWEASGKAQWNATEMAKDGYFGPRKGHYP